MTRLNALWTAFLNSYEVQFCRDHAVLLTVCAAALAVCLLGALAVQ